MAVAHTESAQLASRLDGRVMVIPDLRRMINHWPSGKNVYAPEIEALINAFLEKCLWPNVSREKLGTLTLMVLWQGRLDDHIEALECESQAKAKEFRGKTKEYIAQYLQLSEGPKEPATTPVISDFQPVAKMICQQYDKDQRRRLRVSLFEYIDSTVQEMRYIESGEVPTDFKYEMLRKKTGGTGPLCALAETNDLLSLRKELRKGRTLSVVPVRLWNSQDGDLEAVIREVVDEIEKAVRQFDVCERRLINQSQADANATRQIAATLKTICTGNLNWRCVS
ncbi:terpene synthase family protein [Colletotrichum tofieldiae]|nr:terpene synthase family protein [Colletotrichum tofieldiae]